MTRPGGRDLTAVGTESPFFEVQHQRAQPGVSRVARIDDAGGKGVRGRALAGQRVDGGQDAVVVVVSVEDEGKEGGVRLQLLP